MLKVKVICFNCKQELEVLRNIPERGCDWQLMIVSCHTCRPTTHAPDLADCEPELVAANAEYHIENNIKKTPPSG